MTAITTAAGLAAALAKCVGGETVELGSITEAVRLTNMKFARPVTLAGGTIALPPGAVEWQPAIEFFAASGFALDGVKLVGVGAPGAQCGYGVSVANGAAGIEISGCDLSVLKVGVMLNNCSDVNVERNDFHDLREGVDVVATSDATILENHFVRFTVGAGDHPDGIQFWTASAIRGCANVRVEDNLIEGAPEQRPQGIFGGDSQLGFADFILSRNLIISPLWNGIFFDDGATGLTATDNRILNVIGGPAVQGGPIRPWIKLPASAVNSGNMVVTDATQAQVDAEVASWLAKFRAPPVTTPTPTPTPTVPIDPKALAALRARLVKQADEANMIQNASDRMLNAARKAVADFDALFSGAAK
jgi:hypothetical protein